jgi:hypothetical protein
LAARRKGIIVHVRAGETRKLKQSRGGALSVPERIPRPFTSMEIAMSPNPMRCTLVGGAVVALAILASATASAAQPTGATAPNAAPVVVAQGAAPATTALRSGAAIDGYPAYQRGVRKAAAEGPEALRRYIWRTRMIHNFYYNDFAPKE